MPPKKKDRRKKMYEPAAEERMFPFAQHDAIRTDFLKALPYTGLDQTVLYKTSEFSAVCPFSGFPDIATVMIEYIPKKLVVELKSLKYYFVSYRNIGIYQEDATNRIFQDLYRFLEPKYMKVTTIYNTRGGIDSVCIIEKGKKIV